MSPALRQIFRIFRKISQALELLDEVAVVAVIAAVLLVLAPVVIVRQLIIQGHYLRAAMVGGLWVVCVAAFIRDFRRRTLGWISGGMVAGWLVVALLVGWALQ